MADVAQSVWLDETAEKIGDALCRAKPPATAAELHALSFLAMNRGARVLERIADALEANREDRRKWVAGEPVDGIRRD